MVTRRRRRLETDRIRSSDRRHATKREYAAMELSPLAVLSEAEIRHIHEATLDIIESFGR